MNGDEAWNALKQDIINELKYLDGLIKVEREKPDSIDKMTNINNYKIKKDALQQIQRHIITIEKA